MYNTNISRTIILVEFCSLNLVTNYKLIYTRYKIIKKKEKKLEISLFENKIVKMYIEIPSPLYSTMAVLGNERGNTCRVMMLSLMANHRASHYHSRVPFFTRLSSRCTLPATCKLNYFGFMSVRDIALFTESLRQLVAERGGRKGVSVDERRNENAK